MFVNVSGTKTKASHQESEDVMAEDNYSANEEHKGTWTVRSSLSTKLSCPHQRCVLNVNYNLQQFVMIIS